jgi:hypothetical protein
MKKSCYTCKRTIADPACCTCYDRVNWIPKPERINKMKNLCDNFQLDVHKFCPVRKIGVKFVTCYADRPCLIVRAPKPEKRKKGKCPTKQ